ncbi:hypothetical protein QQX13_10830 [Demequina sp. SYSU T00068]|uniref:LppM family (lipo)protein n=1 Tax=Demequina lignilytica TaxID=3051663 RepID=UPI002627FCBD|nr:hypothetical protein [Demequina sp. SYSU T00068]MDN4491326.1 hypothetical protein [Demequina sp. SYSU T00068]
MKVATRILAAAAAALLLAGCVRVTAETTLGTDDTFDQHAVIAVAPEALTALRQQLGQVDPGELPADALDQLDLESLLDPETFLEQLAPLEEANPGSVDVQPYSDDEGRSGVELTVTDVPLADAGDATATVPLAGATGIVREGDTYVVTLESGAASELEGLGAQASQLRLIENAVDVAVAFTFPGLITEATAGEVDGSTVTLGLSDLLSADSIRIVGGASPQVDWGPFLRWGLVGLAVVVVVGGATLLVLQDRRRRASTALPPPRPGAEGGMGTLGKDDAPPG